ncbi:MAG: phosphohistidine phosphatase SixA [Kofleriaceae bacterium]
MQVFLVRHAEAVSETLELRDPNRHLTPLGRDQARAIGDRMRWHDCLATRIWSSPLVRAVQTAELVAANLHDHIPVEVVPALAPDGDARSVAAALRALGTGAVLIVGHEPLLSAIGSLVAGCEFPSLAKAQAARIIDGRVRWRFAWDAEAAAR